MGRDRIVGILGGMGSEVTADFFLKLIKATPAQKDQDHLRTIIDNNPHIPDRTLALLGKGESPLKELKRTVRNLEKAGAELIAMPCNTAHAYYDELQKSSHIPIINMISETIEYVQRNFPNIKKVGLLATTGTVKARIYHKATGEIDIITPDEVAQEKVMSAVYGAQGIKAGHREYPRGVILEAAAALIEQGAEAIIVGCTEISLGLNQGDLSVPLIDPLQILVGVVVKEAKINE